MATRLTGGRSGFSRTGTVVIHTVLPQVIQLCRCLSFVRATLTVGRRSTLCAFSVELFRLLLLLLLGPFDRVQLLLKPN